MVALRPPNIFVFHKLTITYPCLLCLTFQNPIFVSFCKLWTFLEPFLFGLVGAGVDVQTMIKNPTSVGWGILILFIGLAIRMMVAMVTVVGQGLNMKEKVFVALAWFPKATVQVRYLEFRFFGHFFYHIAAKACLASRKLWRKLECQPKAYPIVSRVSKNNPNTSVITT